MFKKIFTLIIFSLFFTTFSNANFDINARTAILQDYLSGKILYEKDADRKIFPASMTKIMTAIIAFELIKNGELSLDDKFTKGYIDLNHRLELHGICGKCQK